MTMSRGDQSKPVLDLRRIGKRFPGVVALDGVSFDVRAGEFHAICGENGAGKSTLMKILSGVLTEYDGEFLVRGERAAFAGTRDAERAGISIIHQELNLVEQLSVAANIFLGRELKRGPFLDEAAMCSKAAELFSQLGCPIRPSQRVKELRVGDQQLVEIAKALSLKSDILIMDEPTSALTETEVERLFRVIETLRTQGVTILYISHKMEEVFRLSDRITVLRDGRHVKTLDRKATSPREITHLMVGRELENTRLSENRTPGEVVLDVSHLSLAWPGHARRWRLADVSFSLHKGEVLGIAGLMGAGRTELLECLFGANSDAVQGEIRLNGNVVSFSHPAQAKDAGLAMVTEDRKRLGLFAQMTVRENITICTLDEATSGPIVSTKRERSQASESIANVGVKTAGTEAAITGLSGGNQQKCIIARWLRTNPKVLLLDDPTRGIDVGAKAELYQVIDRLCRSGLAIIVTSSELPELITLCDRILVLCEGRLTGELQRGEFSEQRIMELATAQTCASEAEPASLL
ncbi:sugar ABC transporter ATP-binding protein [Planctomicrobium piriforme]|uniref:Ribose transport system ATP-binding protein n=1 Tax=Planctomicrobium piriforme TaxID=1576369 RepID=A0A1I3B6S8_9PLAN|nr:sugar ABC transporter ATP-binding protein [Planctomicrobium piriforme]SFH57669.1 ribose transport system ATP-binding protein [Planctomicrobium piriforme]